MIEISKRSKIMKWVKVQTFKRFVLWKNIQVGRYECFWPEQDPNVLQEKHEDLITKLVNGQVPYKSKKVKKS